MSERDLISESETKCSLGKIIERKCVFGEELKGFPEGGSINRKLDSKNPQNRVQAAIAEAVNWKGAINIVSLRDCEGTIKTTELIREEG